MYLAVAVAAQGYVLYFAVWSSAPRVTDFVGIQALSRVRRFARIVLLAVSDALHVWFCQ